MLKRIWPLAVVLALSTPLVGCANDTEGGGGGGTEATEDTRIDGDDTGSPNRVPGTENTRIDGDDNGDALRDQDKDDDNTQQRTPTLPGRD